LHVTAPQLHFLTGKPLEQLRNGATVSFNFQLSLSTDSNLKLRDRAVESYAISYDLWEEKFSVRSLRAARKPPSLLSATAAEQWCIENIPVSPGSISADEPVWVRLEVRGGDGKETPIFGPNNIGASGISLTSLIEIFSRPVAPRQLRLVAEAGPLKLSDLRRKN
ncbi:MAG: hypothetical protein ABI823_17840, partial [Bryobacteraceae bacterium]